MSTRKSFVLFAFFAVALSPMMAQADASPPTQLSCALNQYSIVAVEPYEIEIRAGHGTVVELRGAQLYIPAQAGLTAEWLQLTLQREFAPASGAGGANACSFSSNNLQVQVVSGGPGFWVRLVAPDPNEGAKVLQRARELVTTQRASR